MGKTREVKLVSEYLGRRPVFRSFRTLSEKQWAVEVPESMLDRLAGGTSAITTFDGDIMVREGYEDSAVHELLHAAGFMPDGIGEAWNEGITQAVAEEICREAGIEVRSTYRDAVGEVRRYLLPRMEMPTRQFAQQYAEAKKKGAFILGRVWPLYGHLFTKEDGFSGVEKSKAFLLEELHSQFAVSDHLRYLGDEAMKNPSRKNATTSKATFTGWTCVTGPEELVSYLVDHATEVAYTEFARNVEVKSVGIKGLRTDWAARFLHTSLPSGKDAWVLQFGGIEHLFVVDDVDTREEASRAIVLAYNEHEMPIVWEEDEAMVRALGGRALMDQRYEVMVRTNDHFDHEAYQWVMRTMAWLVPQGNVRATGLPLLQRDPLNWTKPVRRNPIPSAVGKLAVGDRLSSMIGEEMVYAYRWVPDYADDSVRPGDYVLLDPESGRPYGGPRGKRLTVRVPSGLLEYRQGDEYVYRGDVPKRAHASVDGLKRNPAPGPDENLLLPANQLAGVGKEKTTRIGSDVLLHKDQYGSHRFVLLGDNGEPVAALQVMRGESGQSFVANVYTTPAHRRKGHASRLLAVARKRLGKVEHAKHLSDDGAAWAAARNPSRKSSTDPVVLYHGTPKDFDKLTLKSGGVLWLTDNRAAAEQYVSGHAYAEQSGFLWTVTLKPGARIVDLSDLSIPVVREIYEGVSDARRSTFGPIASDQWPSFADFGLLEAKPWIVSRLKAARYDAVIVKDALQSTGIPHGSFALLRLSAVQSASREPIVIDRSESIGSIEERIAGGVKNNPARKRKTDDKRFGDEVQIVDYFLAGSPKAMEALGGDFADVDCVRCGSKITHVFMTEHGPMGGDCLATLTGDDSTRKAIRATIEKLKWSKISVDHYGGRLQKVVLEQRDAGHLKGECVISTVAYFFDSGRTSERYAHSAKGSVGLSAAVAGWAEENQLPLEVRGEVPGLQASARNPAGGTAKHGGSKRLFPARFDTARDFTGIHRLEADVLQEGKGYTARFSVGDKQVFEVKDLPSTKHVSEVIGNTVPREKWNPDAQILLDFWAGRLVVGSVFGEFPKPTPATDEKLRFDLSVAGGSTSGAAGGSLYEWLTALLEWRHKTAERLGERMSAQLPDVLQTRNMIRTVTYAVTQFDFWDRAARGASDLKDMADRLRVIEVPSHLKVSREALASIAQDLEEIAVKVAQAGAIESAEFQSRWQRCIGLKGGAQ